MATSPVSSIPPAIFAAGLQPFILPAENPQTSPSRQTLSAQPAHAVLQAEGSEAAREQILLTHLPLVRFVARSIHERLPHHVEIEDLVSAGVVGLIDAFNKFDGEKNVQFRSYAQFRIRGAVLDSLRSLDWGSRELRRKGRCIDDAMQRLMHRLGRRPSESEVAAELSMRLGEYQQLIGDLRGLEIGSLQVSHAEDSLEDDLAYLPTAPEEDPLYRCMKSEISARLSAAVAALPEREARVLALYYVEEMTLKEIGVVLGLVESRVSQIRAAAVIHLRARLTGGKMQPERVSSFRPNSGGSKRRQPFIRGTVQRSDASSPRSARRAPVH